MGSCVSSSHLVVTALALRFTNAAATRSQPHTGKCPVSRPHTEKTARRVSTLGTFGRSPSKLAALLPDVYPNTRAPLLSCSGFLQVSPNRSRYVFTWAAEHTTFVNKYVIDIRGGSATDGFILPDHSFYDGPHNLIFTVWNGHSDLSTWICRYARRRSTMAAFGSWLSPFPHGLSPHVRIRRIHVLIHLAIVHNWPDLLLDFPVIWPLMESGLKEGQVRSPVTESANRSESKSATPAHIHLGVA